MAVTSLPATPSLSMALVRAASPGVPPSWLLPAANVTRRSNIGSSWASTNSTRAPSAVVQLWMFSWRRLGALPSSSANDCRVLAGRAALLPALAALSARAGVASTAASARVRMPVASRVKRGARRSLMGGLLGQYMGNAQAFAGEVGARGVLDVLRGDTLEF